MKDSTKQSGLLAELFKLIEAHRPVFKQERSYQRMIGMILGEVFNFGRHTITQSLLGLGMLEGDWSAWYRLFSQPRFEEEGLNARLFAETVSGTQADEPYVIAVDGTPVIRSGLKMPGTCWLKSPHTPAFRRGIERIQRFVHGAWLTPMEDGYSRAIPIRWLPAFPPKAVASDAQPCTEWKAGKEILEWVRKRLDLAGRNMQPLVAVVDGAFEVLDLWRELPERTILLARTARNRSLFWLPEEYAGRGRPPSYGEKAPHPADWLHAGLRHWPALWVRVRGKEVHMRYQVLGAFVREGLAERPLFLIVVKGIHKQVGKRRFHYKHRGPSFYLVNAVFKNNSWQLPLPIECILAWLWQRWEIEVAHREMKSGLGLGEKQCWNRRSAITSVQWSAWVYAILVLAAWRTWGLTGLSNTRTPWWSGPKRWSFNTLWRQYRAQLWGARQFHPLWLSTSNNWQKKELWLAGLSNSISFSSRI